MIQITAISSNDLNNIKDFRLQFFMFISNDVTVHCIYIFQSITNLKQTFILILEKDSAFVSISDQFSGLIFIQILTKSV